MLVVCCPLLIQRWLVMFVDCVERTEAEVREKRDDGRKGQQNAKNGRQRRGEDATGGRERDGV